VKIKIVVLVAICLISGGVWLSSYAQQNEENKKATQGQSQTQTDAETMQQTSEGMCNNAMMAQCRHMMRTLVHPDSPMSMCAMKEQLGLSEKQIKDLMAIEEKAGIEAKNVLTGEQRNKFEALTKDWKPQFMVQGMQGMMPHTKKTMKCQTPMCPMTKTTQEKQEKQP
jgi:hypothetical protein